MTVKNTRNNIINEIKIDYAESNVIIIRDVKSLSFSKSYKSINIYVLYKWNKF